jgi:hypothetical protein
MKNRAQEASMADKIDKLADAVEKLSSVVEREAGLNAEERKVNAQERKINGEFRSDVIAFQNETRDNFEALSAKVDTNRLLLTRHETRTDGVEQRLKRIEDHLGFDKDPN